MSEPFVGEIRMFAGNFSIRGWAFCDGQLLVISANNALFSLLGTTYGGDGRTTFGLPDLRGRLPIHMGNGPGLSSRPLGRKLGQESANISLSNIPSHNHDVLVSSAAGTQNAGAGGFLASSPGVRMFRPQAPGGTMLDADTIGQSPGDNQSHSNLMPSLCVNFIIALTGIFPSRN